MNSRDLQYFLAVAELEHFGKAALKCNVSQPTLSGQIKKLEEHLGIMLFERNNRHVRLTEVGHNIAVVARRILVDIDTMRDIAAQHHDPLSGKFKLGAFPTLSTYLFPAFVTNIKEILPNIRLILQEEKTAVLLDQLKNGDIDAAFLALPIQDDALVCEHLFDDEFYLAVPDDHALVEYQVIEQEMLSSYQLLLLEEGHCLRDQALDVCQLHGIGEEQDFKATGLETLRQMVKAGTGITFMPKIALQQDESDITYIPFTAPAPVRRIGLVWRKTSVRQEIIKKIVELYR